MRGAGVEPRNGCGTKKPERGWNGSCDVAGVLVLSEFFQEVGNITSEVLFFLRFANTSPAAICPRRWTRRPPVKSRRCPPKRTRAPSLATERWKFRISTSSRGGINWIFSCPTTRANSSRSGVIWSAAPWGCGACGAKWGRAMPRVGCLSRIGRASSCCLDDSFLGRG